MARNKLPVDQLAYSVEDLASAFPLSIGWWWKQIRSGALPSKRFGRRVLIMKNDLDQYIQNLENHDTPDSRQ